MPTRRRHVIAACALLLGSSLWLAPTWLSAQNRFEALKQDTIAEVPGLRIITVRDTLLDTCYTLFMSEPSGVADIGAPPPIDDERQQAIQRLRDAAERHDREVGNLKAQFETKTGLTPEMARVPGLAVAKNVSLADYLVRYEVERLKVDTEYDGVLRTLIPGSYPAASATPGMRTGSWEDAAEATRRSLANPDPAPLKTLADPGGLNSQLASLSQQLSNTPRLSASGPVPCSPPKPDGAKVATPKAAPPKVPPRR
ncbi:MAG TPA: hypothetical protein VFP91_06040 [Vicinamibacterales bacterium]|nr:hypothetical protein [Vicinamibacterales bacterium]